MARERMKVCVFVGFSCCKLGRLHVQLRDVRTGLSPVPTLRTRRELDTLEKDSCP